MVGDVMEDTGPRNITDADANAIAGALKRQILADFKVEVGTGVLALARKAIIYILLLLAIYGVTQAPGFFANIHMGNGGSP